MRKVNNSKMRTTSNHRNIENFKELLPEFFYSISTDSRILKAINPLKRDFKHVYADAVFQVDANDLRRWIKIDLAAEDDKAYQLYIMFITAYSSKHPYVYKYNLRAYDVFKSGKVSDGKQEFKLFKFCSQNGILSDSQIDEICQYRTNGDLWLCISRNPVDMMFCSTGHSWSSCMNLYSDGSCAYYMSAGALCSDPNRAIIFTCNGKISRQRIKGIEFKYFRYLQRHFAYLVNHDEIYIDRWYPNASIGIATYMTKAGYKIADAGSRRFSSRLNFIPPKFENGEIALPYMDNINITTQLNKNGKERCRQDTDTGRNRSFFDFDNGDGFDAIGDFDDLFGNFAICIECGERIRSEDDECFAFDAIYCEACFNDIFTLCIHCNDVIYQNDCTENQYGDPVCGYCFNDKYFECAICGDVYDLDDSCIDERGEVFCPDCYADKYIRDCYHCDSQMDTEREDFCGMYNRHWLCEDCLDAQLIKVREMCPSWLQKIQASKDFQERKMSVQERKLAYQAA